MYGEGKHILVVDNDAASRELIGRALSDEGFSVTLAADGLAAIRAAATESFALALAAADLPGTLDGPKTMQQIRSRQPGLKVLFTGDLARRSGCPLRDCDDFIIAPFARRDLIGCVFELLQREVVLGHAGRRDRSRVG